ncbi:ATP-binding protein [Chitinivorax sp. PXF-14]|uniref:sensor histidine kinase n=1 Tax=Chitinivorax sp. PXF-14 TaxID=3230488 RepID=UPI003465028B
MTPQANRTAQTLVFPERRRVADSTAMLVSLLDTLVCVLEPATGRVRYRNPAFDAVFAAAGEAGFLEWIEEQLGAAAFDEEVQLDLRYLPADRWLRVHAQDVLWQGEPARLFTLTDISDRVDIERHRQVNQQRLFFATRDMSVGEMSSVLAHELKHPLATIINLVAGIERRIKQTQASGEMLQALALTRLQAERANAIIARVREFVRRREPRREPLDVATLIRGVTRLMALDTAAHRVRVTLDIERELPWPLADSVMVEQVLLNLIKNAIEAMADAPLHARFLRLVALRAEDGLVRVSVIDSGAGIGPEAQERLFNPFYSTKAEGLGIGLALCRSLIEYHGGMLTFDNNADVGCAFSFTLPCATEAA